MADDGDKAGDFAALKLVLVAGGSVGFGGDKILKFC